MFKGLFSTQVPNLAIHIGRLAAFDLTWNEHISSGEICSKENRLLIKIHAIFHARAASHPLQGPNPPLSRIQLASVERGLQTFSCYPG